MKNKKYVVLVELFDENGNSSYKCFDIDASSFLFAYDSFCCFLQDEYSEYNAEILSIHRCLVNEVNDG